MSISDVKAEISRQSEIVDDMPVFGYRDAWTEMHFCADSVVEGLEQAQNDLNALRNSHLPTAMNLGREMADQSEGVAQVLHEVIGRQSHNEHTGPLLQAADALKRQTQSRAVAGAAILKIAESLDSINEMLDRARWMMAQAELSTTDPTVAATHAQLKEKLDTYYRSL